MTRPPLPAYLDGLIAAYRAGQTGRSLHLGYWDGPPDPTTPCAPEEFAAAQARLTGRVIELVALRPGQRVLDVGCGFGGTLAEIGARLAGMALIGLNIDRRQLELCRGIMPRSGGSLALVEADACALPFAPATFDHLFCVEALFHFRSRQLFLAEAARLDRPDGTLLVSDILLRHPGAAAPCLRRWAAAEGLDLKISQDWTAATLPSYRTAAPDDRPELRRHPDAGNVLRWLHSHGWLTYQILVFRRR